MTEEKDIGIYWTATIHHTLPIKAGAVVSVKAEPTRSSNELLLIIDGKVYGCLVRQP